MPTFTVDPGANKTPEQLKADCRRLSRALHDWQRIALAFAAKHGVEALPPRMRDEVVDFIEAYGD